MTWTDEEWAERHAIFLAGVEYGRREANRVAAQAIAYELLHAQALEALGMARKAATERHGPAWAALVCDEGEVATDDDAA